MSIESTVTRLARGWHIGLVWFGAGLGGTTQVLMLIDASLFAFMISSITSLVR